MALRRGRWSESGRTYLVTFTTTARNPVFADWQLAVGMVRASRSPHIWRASRLLCWVLMPDHWHGLVEIGAMDTLSQLINRVKGSTSRAVQLLRDTRGHLWSKGFHDHAVRRDEDLLAIARYVICNPVRAGLVARVGEYPYWDAVWLDGDSQQAVECGGGQLDR